MFKYVYFCKNLFFLKAFGSILFSLLLLFCFSATPTAQVYACNNCCCKKEAKEISKKQKKDCCKTHSDKESKNTKGNCKGDCNDCSCCVSGCCSAIGEQIAFNLVSIKQKIPEKQITPYKQFPPKSIFIEFWQPPKI